MITTRTKAAGGAALIAGGGLALILLIGNAGATTPAHAPSTAPAGIVATKSVDVGAGTFAADPNAPRPTATITASAAPPDRKATQGRNSGVQTVRVAPGARIAVPAAETPTSTVSASALPAAPGK